MHVVARERERERAGEGKGAKANGRKGQELAAGLAGSKPRNVVRGKPTPGLWVAASAPDDYPPRAFCSGEMRRV